MSFYTETKNTSKVFKTATDMVEISIMSASKPVINVLTPQLDRLNDVAVEHLDKLQEKYPVINAEDLYAQSRQAVGDAIFSRFTSDSSASAAKNTATTTATPTHSNETPRNRRRGASRGESHAPRASSPSHRSRGHHHRATPPGVTPSYAPYTYPSSSTAIGTATVAPPRSRWQHLLVEAGGAVGAAGAAMSEESMKSLKYCHQWLQYATRHIEAQVIVLRDLIAGMVAPTSSSTAVVPSSSAATSLASIKREVVETLRKVIEVMSRYAGACLPGQAKNNVRAFILSLPRRLASINRVSVEHSPMSSPQLGASGALSPPNTQTAEQAHRVLGLANESLDMLRSVANIFSETVDRADAWVERLRTIGVTPRAVASGAELQQPPWTANGASGYDNAAMLYTRGSSTSSSSTSVTSSSTVDNNTLPSLMNMAGSRKPRGKFHIDDEDDEDAPVLDGDDLSEDESSESEAEDLRMMEVEVNDGMKKRKTIKSKRWSAAEGMETE